MVSASLSLESVLSIRVSECGVGEWSLVGVVTSLSLPGLLLRRLKVSLVSSLADHCMILRNQFSSFVEGFQVVDFELVTLEGVLELANQCLSSLYSHASSNDLVVVSALLQSCISNLKVPVEVAMVGHFQLVGLVGSVVSIEAPLLLPSLAIGVVVLVGGVVVVVGEVVGSVASSGILVALLHLCVHTAQNSCRSLRLNY